MLLSAITPQLPLSPPNSSTNQTHPRLSSSNPSPKPPIPLPSIKSLHSYSPSTSTSLRHVSTHTLSDDDESQQPQPTMVSSASAVSAAICKVSTSAVNFTQRIEKTDHRNHKLIMPSHDFRHLSLEQLDLFRRTVERDAILSVYVRPAGSYVMDQLELRRVTSYPGVKAAEIVILVGNFTVPTGLRAAEAVLSSRQMVVVGEHRAVVFPMVKHPFVVGFLVAELPEMEKVARWTEGGDLVPEEAYALSSPSPGLHMKKSWEIQSLDYEALRKNGIFTADQRSNAINISHTLAMAHVMDQKAMLLQQSSWQNNVRMGALVEQIRGPLSSIRTLSKMLSTQLKKSEISNDIVEGILVQGDRMSDTVQELQDAVYLTKANIVRYNEETLKKMHNSSHSRSESLRSELSDDLSRDRSSNRLEASGALLSLSAKEKDLEMPMPPLALAPRREYGIRPCNVSDVLTDLVDAVRPLAHKQQRIVELSELSESLQVAIEEPALRQALSNLIEGALLRTQVGGKVEIISTRAPAGGALLVIDDNGPDMHYMMHSLTPFGAELFSENMIEDNMTWNFVAGLTVAREILDSYGCVVRVISPRSTDAALGAGGTRVELWLPSFAALSDTKNLTQEA
ncbi:chloroplast sensor kinase, chloroplastic isoform X2 [Durio zibethinus]|uniref:Chloroplast sensor kinase, chloroplastic isoform X2 n=1 Tax=Durio zibethinus TaxID=66656 RepID=A0A6P6BGG6_DURZI|nr:chloroplast sensor kinase, chloroplastic isoform X2 [Durio zibethinus]